MEDEGLERDSTSDSVEGAPGERPFDLSSSAWLVGQGLRFLNGADKEDELAYQRVTELLRDRNDSVETLIGLLQKRGSGDPSLRWNLLHLLGDVGDASAADFLARAAVEPLPEETAPDEGCEGPRDTELLVRTMAVHALRRVADRHPEAGEQLLSVIESRPDTAVLVEAVRAIDDPQLRERVRDTLPSEDHWMLDIRQARIDEISAEPERKDVEERGFTPPKRGVKDGAPQVVRRIREEF